MPAAIGAFVGSLYLPWALPMKEPPGPPRPPAQGLGLASAAREIRQFAVDSFRAFTGSRGAFIGVVIALDALAGLLCIPLLPLMAKAKKKQAPPVGAMVPEAIEP